MRKEPHVSQCPSDETLAAWVDGRLSKEQTSALIEHASQCGDCIAMIDAANETFHAEGGNVVEAAPVRWQRWLVAAAAVLLLAIPAAFLVRSRRDPVRELVEVAPRSARASEARLSGGFAWAPYRGSMRASGAGVDTEQLKLMGAAAEAIDRARRDSSPESQRAAALAMVLIERSGEAIAALAAETKRAPSSAQAWSDLAAAQYAAALAGRTSLYTEALGSVNRALRIDARSGEALFNRALILERLGLRDEARAAWQRYLDVDAASPWAEEAREHLRRLSAASAHTPFEADRERLERAAAAGDGAAVRSLVARHAERARAFAEVEYLGRWAEARQGNDGAGAARWLAVSRSIGNALAAISGESLLRDAVRAIDAGDAARIANAHLVYRRGRIAFSRRQPADAERDLRLAAEQFAAANDPMALAARSYAAGARLAQNDVLAARRELTALATEVDAARGYLSLAGQVRWELGRAMLFDGDPHAAVRVLGEAESLFRRAREGVNEATVGTMLADALIEAGRPDEAWRAHVRAFETFHAAGRTDLLDGAIGAAAMTALRAGRLETTRALVAINESLERGMADDLRLTDTLVRKALLDLDLDAAAAQRSAEEAKSVAMRIPDASLRTRQLADADFAMAAVLVRSDARRAHDLATRAIAVYGDAGMSALFAELCLVRARASMRLGDPSAAERDLIAGMAAVERHPMRAGGAVIGTGTLDAGNALYEEAIGLQLDRGDVGAALATAERMRGATGAADELRTRLKGTGTAVVELVVLPRQVVSFVVTERGVTAVRRAIAREDVIALASSGAGDSESALYDLLIRPSHAALADARALIVVPGDALDGVAFAALRDRESGRALIERMPVAIARSAFGLREDASAAVPSMLAAVALAPNEGQRALPEVDAELSEIGRLYRGTIVARGVAESSVAADVLHIAGHTDLDAAGNDALAAGGAQISWSTIASMRDMPPVVVLSACNTLRGPRDRDRRALSLAGAFAAAGARDVVGTLAPIGDRDARLLFRALHEQLARGVAAPAALRRVQLAALNQPGGVWRRLAVLTSVIHRNE